MSENKIGCHGQQSFLVVFDFDHTLLECNSDTAIPDHLGLTKQQDELIQRQMQWTNLISTLIGPFTKEELTAAAQAAVTVHPGVVKMLQFLMSVVQHRTDQPAHVAGEIPPIEVCIASDANTHFIEAIVAKHFPFLTLTSLHTNPYCDLRGTDEETPTRKSKLVWYEPEPGHNCSLCCSRGRPHMCKSRIIHRCLKNSKLVDPTIVFVGDGSNDYCPVLNCLRPRDHVFARLDFPLSKDLAIQGGGCCHMRVWKSGDDLLTLFEQVLLKSTYRLPTVVRFGDYAAEEFRYRTLLKRVPQVVRAVISENKEDLSETAVAALSQLANSLEDPHGLVMPLPGQQEPPQWLMNYSRTATFVQTTSDGKGREGEPLERGKKVTWAQIPWLHGEIYMYQLMTLLAHLADSSPVTTTTTTTLLVTPHATHSPVVAFEDRALCVQRQRTVESPVHKETVVADEVDHPAHRTAQRVAPENQFFDPAFLAIPTSAAFIPRVLDIFHESKDKMLNAMLSTRIVPMVDARPWSREDGLEEVLLGMLWGNSVDLSLLQENRDEKLKSLQGAFPPAKQILGNDMKPLSEYVERLARGTSTTAHIDIVLDNAGVELTGDLCFAAWILLHSSCLSVTLHLKSMPFYVSDTTYQDVDRLFAALRSQSSSDACREFVSLLEHHRDVTKRLQLSADACWVSPMEYRDLPPQVVNAFFFTQRLTLPESSDPDALYAPPMPHPEAVQRFAKSALVIFKGDLNFRRLVGDRYWDQRSFFAASQQASDVDATFDALTSFSKCARSAPTLQQAVEDFWPTSVVPLAALRTLKSELTAGVPLDAIDALDADKATRANWRVTGDFAVALFTGPPSTYR
ncbi:Hypothetical protein, putative [Bodo saltans]|uniref:Damage-control phosphatase ARMT1-like metal-binding domain-containing protein n=1 Tax=Bodo saltans TaxID=75058 RepID=A0A0S4J9G5_BODSA|nr:Hypothetical protein, putative [Bodo saltans]|eukprot:CUG86860.1 Hypothetical protein, putative [Bodo saltans]